MKYLIILIIFHISFGIGQTIQFDFLNFRTERITEFESTLIFDDCSINDTLISFKSFLTNESFESYEIISYSYEDFNSEIPNWNWPESPAIELKKVEFKSCQNSRRNQRFISEILSSERCENVKIL